MSNIIDLFPKPIIKKCSFCKQPYPGKEAVETEKGDVCICYKCIKLATEKLKESD